MQFPTHHHSGQLQPRHIQRRMRVPARKRCAPPIVCGRCRSLSSTGPLLHCDWLWVLQLPPSGHDPWWFCVPNRGRILMCENRTEHYTLVKGWFDCWVRCVYWTVIDYSGVPNKVATECIAWALCAFIAGHRPRGHIFYISLCFVSFHNWTRNIIYTKIQRKRSPLSI